MEFVCPPFSFCVVSRYGVVGKGRGADKAVVRGDANCEVALAFLV